MTISVVDQALAAADSFTPGVEVRGLFNFSIAGTWVGTLTVQRSFDQGISWRDVEQFAANVERVGEEDEAGVLYRAGFKSGEYTSGTANVRISK